MMSQAAQTHLAGHMRPAGRVFETPDVHHVFVMNTGYERWSLLSRFQGSPVIKLTTKTFTILFIADISILDISHLISNPTSIKN